MSEYYYYGMAAVMLLITCWTFAAVRWFHTCRAPKKEHSYIWPDRKLQVLVYLCSVVLLLNVMSVWRRLRILSTPEGEHGHLPLLPCLLA